MIRNYRKLNLFFNKLENFVQQGLFQKMYSIFSCIVATSLTEGNILSVSILAGEFLNQKND